MKKKKKNNKIKFLVKQKKIIKEFKKKIDKYNNIIWCPNKHLKFKKIKKNTWFDISIGRSCIKNSIDLKFDKKYPVEIYKCKKVEMKLNNYQKRIINNWFNSYIKMYNKTLKLIKRRRILGLKQILNFKMLRTKYLKDDKREILRYYEDNKKEVVKSHILDYAIKLACSNYKSALTNYKNGNIKHFRIKYWKYNKGNKLMDIENTYFGKNGFCFNVFGKINYAYNKKIFDITTISTTCKLYYDYSLNSHNIIYF